MIYLNRYQTVIQHAESEVVDFYLDAYLSSCRKLRQRKENMGAYKNILIEVSSAMNLASENLKVSADSMDAELMEAVLVNTLSSLPSYLQALVANK